STKLYGIIQPNVLGLTAIRHTVVPNIGFRYSPDYSKPGDLYRDAYFDPRQNRVINYSIFEEDEAAGFGSAPGGERQEAVSFGLSNIFDAKIAQGDTIPDKKVQLLQLDLSTSYNAVAKEFRWAPVSTNATVNLGNVGTLNGNATFTLYDTDTAGLSIPKLLINQGKGLWRATDVGVSFGTTFSDQGFATGVSQTAVGDSAAARRERFNFEPGEFNDREFFGETVRGNPAFRIPWQLSFSGNYNLRRTLANNFEKNFGVNIGFSFTLTPTTVISSSGSYNLTVGKFLVPEITLRKDLHCWQMSLQWQPAGYGRGFYFQIGLKAPQLQDIKLERTDRTFSN
ncbi:MAG: putative LPS assembly protein LptD, partial [Candidatus Kapaibacterium sp.]